MKRTDRIVRLTTQTVHSIHVTKVILFEHEMAIQTVCGPIQSKIDFTADQHDRHFIATKMPDLGQPEF